MSNYYISLWLHSRFLSLTIEPCLYSKIIRWFCVATPIQSKWYVLVFFFFFTNFLFSTISQNFFMFPSRRWLAAMIESFITLINRRNSSWNTSTGWICKTRGTNEKVKIPPHPEDSSKAFKYLNIMFIFHLKLNILKRSSIGCRLSYLVIYRNSLQPYLNQTEFANKP